MLIFVFTEVCANYVTNNENNDLQLYASVNRADAGMALAGSGGYWQGGGELATWKATVTNDCCGIYSIEFEVYNAWEVDIFVKISDASSTFVEVSGK